MELRQSKQETDPYLKQQAVESAASKEHQAYFMRRRGQELHSFLHHESHLRKLLSGFKLLSVKRRRV
jgi:hypothetical protein